MQYIISLYGKASEEARFSRTSLIVTVLHGLDMM